MPVDAPQRAASRPIRRSRAGVWRAATLVGVHLLIAAHLTHWWLSGETLSPLEPSEAMELARHSLINAGLVFFAATIAVTAVTGRFFCGWGCHLVALQDSCRWILAKVGIRPRPLRSRTLLWVPAIAFLYMFIWPAVYRLWHREPFRPWTVELTTSGFWDTFPGWTVGIATFAVCGFVAVYFLGAKGFCTYACPYGAAFGWADRLAPLRIRVTDACAGCAHCTAVCSSNVRVHEEVATFGMVTSPGCMKCLDCVSVCPNDALYVGLGRPSLLARPLPGRERPHRAPELSRFEEALVGIAFAAFFFVVRGLYGWFPFLLSLGLSAIVAYLVLQGVRLLSAPNLRIRRWALKRGGRLLPAGYLFLGAMALIGLFWFHSAIVRYHLVAGERLYRETAPLRSLLDAPAPPAPASTQADPGSVGQSRTTGSRLLAEGDRRLVQRSRGHLERVDRWGLAANAQIRMQIAWLALLEGDAGGFERHFREAFDSAPESAGLRIGVADHFQRQGEPERAEELYFEALEIDPGAASASLNFGSMRAGQGRYLEAESIFAAAMEATPELPELPYNAALTQLALGRPEVAVELFERSLELDPELIEARENLAGLLCGLGRFDEGIAHFLVAIEQSPEDPQTRRLLARAYQATGDHDAARRQLEAARELDG